MGDFFGKEIFGTSHPTDDSFESLEQHPTFEYLKEDFTMKEFDAAIKQAKNRKSPGSNGIPIELIKKLHQEPRKVLLAALNRYHRDPDYDSDDWHDMHSTGFITPMVAAVAAVAALDDVNCGADDDDCGADVAAPVAALDGGNDSDDWL